MRPYLAPLLLTLAVVAASAVAEDVRPPDPAALQAKISELERQVELLNQDLREIRRQLQVAKVTPLLTPQQAYDSSRLDPARPVTVEFGVVPSTNVFFNDIDPQQEPIYATWDWFLEDKTQFTVILTPQAYRGLRIPSKNRNEPPIKPAPGQQRADVMKHIGENGIRVTGRLEPDGRSMVVRDPSKVVLFLTQQPGSEVYFSESPLPDGR
jgi:hypothetical protein